jgi:uroporphyrinogen III methyltransferase/synthase
MSLSGKTILITRAAHQTDIFVRLIKEQNGIPIIFPTIEITKPGSWDKLDQSLKNLYMFDGIAFTSVNGVEYFFQRFVEQNISAQLLKGKALLAVGEKTKRALDDYGLTVTLMPEKFTAQDLASMLQQEDLTGKYFLFPKGNLAKDTLPEALKSLGASVDEVIVYETRIPTPANIKEVKTLLSNGKIDVITFTSPSTVKNFFYLIKTKQFPKGTMIAAIGPSTANAIEECGLDVDIQPTQSTIEGLVEAIQNHYQSEI